MRAGLEACFAKVNEMGGIQGRKIRMITKDDGYEPSRAIQNVRELVDEERVQTRASLPRFLIMKTLPHW